MKISSAQCRAARALLGWSQADLEGYSGVAKKTIADFEREARYPQERTNEALRGIFEAFGVVFIPQNGGGAGVRFRLAMPSLFRRDDVPERRWIAFAFDYKQKRVIGFVSYDALARISLDDLQPIDVFDRDRARILLAAAEKVDANDFDPDGRVLILPGDLKPLEFVE
jgi:transcriptional regulator with XRE-family HTH domain